MAMKKPVLPKRWIPLGGYKGYEQPANAIVGASDTGMASDSPSPSDVVQKELMVVKDTLNKKGIPVKLKTTSSSNVFMVKRWLVVKNNDFKKAYKISHKFIQNMPSHYIHEAYGGYAVVRKRRVR